MSDTSSSPAAWWSLLEPAPEAVFYQRGDPDDPRLGEVVHRWTGGPVELRPGQPVLVGFPCDEGVRRNGGRPGAALAPNAIREQLYRFTDWDPSWWEEFRLSHLDCVDLGNVRLEGPLESAQESLGVVLSHLLQRTAIPILLGGGHETAYGHYLGYVAAEMDCAIMNIDAHLDVRPYARGGHSGSSFRQAFEHSSRPLGSGRYLVFGAQRQSVAEAHWEYVRQQGGHILWWKGPDVLPRETDIGRFQHELSQLGDNGQAIFLSVDADAFRQADVPGVSAPSPVGLDGSLWPEIALRAGSDCHVRSIELVEVNPLFDRDNQTTRWAALGIRQFLVGLALRKTADERRQGRAST